MFSFFLPKYVKQGRQFAQDATKLLNYNRDRWSEVTVTDFEKGIEKLKLACRESDGKAIEESAFQLDQICKAHLPVHTDAAWRENVEVFLVAIVVALAVRTFFLQPFTIPTGSMQPTLNGILGFTSQEPPPNPLLKLVDTAIFGRTWIDAVAQDDETIDGINEVKRFFFFTYTEVHTRRVVFQDDGPRETGQTGNTYLLHGPQQKVTETFRLDSMRNFRRGEPIARGYINTGDHVFVDKLTYHFRTPTRGDVFVFNTQRLPTLERRRGGGEPNDPNAFAYPPMALAANQQSTRVEMDRPSQFYIKRLVGLPGDELRIDAPKLFINGHEAEEPAIRRVMAALDGYEGYSFGYPSFLLPAFRNPTDAFHVPAKDYFAMGDNSYHSSDSRDWGPVPQENIMGRGVFVYWPFGRHWGLIR